MLNKNYYSNQTHVLSPISSPRTSPYRVLRISHSPQRQYLSTSPSKQIIKQIHHPEKQIFSPLKIQQQHIQSPQYQCYYSKVQSPSPSSVYYGCTNMAVATQERHKKRQEPMQQYNVWQGYDSSKNIVDEITGVKPRCQDISSMQKQNNSSYIHKNVFRKPLKQTSRDNYFLSSTPVNRIEYQQVRRLSPAKNYECCFMNAYR